MPALTCAICGFDGSRWSDTDLERTLVHAADLVGYVLDGADDELTRAARAGTVDTSDLVDTDGAPVAATHALMHRLEELASHRRTREPFAPMTGRVESLHASVGGVPKPAIPMADIGFGGVEGDVQGNRTHHGRPWQAICLYSAERIADLAGEGHPIVAGGVGENVTIAGVDWSRLRGGLTITIGDVVLRTSAPAAPCRKIGANFADGDWNRIDHDEHPGWARWYASVRRNGIVRPGDELTVSS
jgi:MOSC domain-containing protein YiiM